LSCLAPKEPLVIMMSTPMSKVPASVLRNNMKKSPPSEPEISKEERRTGLTGGGELELAGGGSAGKGEGDGDGGGVGGREGGSEGGGSEGGGNEGGGGDGGNRGGGDGGIMIWASVEATLMPLTPAVWRLATIAPSRALALVSKTGASAVVRAGESTVTELDAESAVRLAELTVTVGTACVTSSLTSGCGGAAGGGGA